jgi:hypothetical protein
MDQTSSQQGSIYGLDRNKIVKLVVPGGATGGHVSDRVTE